MPPNVAQYEQKIGGCSLSSKKDRGARGKWLAQSGKALRGPKNPKEGVSCSVKEVKNLVFASKEASFRQQQNRSMYRFTHSRVLLEGKKKVGPRRRLQYNYSEREGALRERTKRLSRPALSREIQHESYPSLEEGKEYRRR